MYKKYYKILKVGRSNWNSNKKSKQSLSHSHSLSLSLSHSQHPTSLLKILLFNFCWSVKVVLLFPLVLLLLVTAAAAGPAAAAAGLLILEKKAKLNLETWVCNKDEMLKYQTTMLEGCYKPLLGVPPSATVSEIMLRLLLVLSESTSRCCCCCFSDLGFFFSPRFLLELDSLKNILN